MPTFKARMRMNGSQAQTRTARTSRMSGRTQALGVLASLLLLTTLFSQGLSHVAQAREQVPLMAEFTTTGSGAACGPQMLCVSVTGSGVATLLGRASIAKNVVVQITSSPCPGGTIRSYTAEATLTGANGDTLALSGSGTICAGPNGVQASGLYSVTGGTGRFSGASGTVAEIIRRSPTGPETTCYLGTISSPGS